MGRGLGSTLYTLHSHNGTHLPQKYRVMRTSVMGETGRGRWRGRKKKYTGKDKSETRTREESQKHEKVYEDTSVRGHRGRRDNYKKNNGQLVWLRNVAEEGWERIKGVRGQQKGGTGGSDWWKPWVTGPWRKTGHLASSQSHTHVFVNAELLRTPSTLFDPTHTSKVTHQSTEDIHAHTFLFTEWPQTNPCPHVDILRKTEVLSKLMTLPLDSVLFSAN